MKKSLMFAAALCLGLSACATAPASTGTVASASGSPACAITADAMYALETAYNVPAQAYVAADTNHTLPDNVKASVQPILVRAYAALRQARLFYSTGNSLFCGAANEVQTDTAQANSLIGATAN